MTRWTRWLAPLLFIFALSAAVPSEVGTSPPDDLAIPEIQIFNASGDGFAFWLKASAYTNEVPTYFSVSFEKSVGAGTVSVANCHVPNPTGNNTFCEAYPSDLCYLQNQDVLIKAEIYVQGTGGHSADTTVNIWIDCGPSED